MYVYSLVSQSLFQAAHEALCMCGPRYVKSCLSTALIAGAETSRDEKSLVTYDHDPQCSFFLNFYILCKLVFFPYCQSLSCVIAWLFSCPLNGL